MIFYESVLNIYSVLYNSTMLFLTYYSVHTKPIPVAHSISNLVCHFSQIFKSFLLTTNIVLAILLPSQLLKVLYFEYLKNIYSDFVKNMNMQDSLQMTTTKVLVLYTSL